MTLDHLAALFAVASHTTVSENDLEQLATDELVERSGDSVWEVSARGQAFIDHVRSLPLPRQLTQWVMPSDDPPFSLATLGSAVQFKPMHLSMEEGTPPPAPPLRRKRVIPTDPEELRLEAVRMMDAGYGMNEVKEQLELTDPQAQQFFFGK